MRPRSIAVLLLLAAPSARAAGARVELVPELGNLVSAPGASAAAGAATLQLSQNSLIPTLNVAAGGLASPAAPTLALAPLAPSAMIPVQAAAKPVAAHPVGAQAVAAQVRALELNTLAAPAREGAEKESGPSAFRAAFFDQSAARAPLSENVPAAASEDAPKRTMLQRLLRKTPPPSASETAAQVEAAKPRGARAVLDAYEDGSLAVEAPALNALLEEEGQRAMREVLSKAKFKIFFPYGGLTGTHIYVSDEMPGVILKIYYRLFDRLGLPSDASRGYALAKAKLGGLFVDTSILKGVELEINGRKRRVPWALIQQRVEVKNVKNWAERANAVVDAMNRRGVEETDLGPRMGVYEPHLARNLGEAPDGRLVHFDADFFKSRPKKATEAARRVPDPEPLRAAARAAQAKRLTELWSSPP